MISGLRGKIIEKELNFITIDVGGVGYKVFVSNIFLEHINKIDKNKEVYIHTYLAVRENALDLYGFHNEDDKSLFQLLLTISGVGPKSAINIMNSVTRDMIEESIDKDDAKYLSKISGLGKKTAEKIILGLKDKIGHAGISGSNKNSDNSLVIDALISLGYNQKDVIDVMKKMNKKDKNHQELIKEALKVLGNN